MIQKKICVLGATGVGKTSLVKRYVSGIFSDKYLTTIGVKIDKKEVECQGDTVQLLLWDMEGIDRYCGFNPRYLRGASAFLIVMDQTRSQSLLEGMEIIQMAKKHTDIPAVMVVNKTDLSAAWHWDSDAVNQRAAQFADCFYTSAKTGDKIDDLFTKVACLALE